ncbi:hypothetical protein [Arthrobacter sp. NA-172]|uniref:hypothetical protein n=1 Tax=Arthrobacter sp. NA-172 TaxID=3367524 RepID=UPI0037542FB8
MKRSSPGATTAPFARGGTVFQTAFPHLPELARRRANNPEAWDALVRELRADFA